MLPTSLSTRLELTMLMPKLVLSNSCPSRMSLWSASYKYSLLDVLRRYRMVRFSDLISLLPRNAQDSSLALGLTGRFYYNPFGSHRWGAARLRSWTLRSNDIHKGKVSMFNLIEILFHKWTGLASLGSHFCGNANSHPKSCNENRSRR